MPDESDESLDQDSSPRRNRAYWNDQERRTNADFWRIVRFAIIGTVLVLYGVNLGSPLVWGWGLLGFALAGVLAWKRQHRLNVIAQGRAQLKAEEDADPPPPPPEFVDGEPESTEPKSAPQDAPGDASS